MFRSVDTAINISVNQKILTELRPDPHLQGHYKKTAPCLTALPIKDSFIVQVLV